MKTNFYVYALFHPTGDVFYIGKGNGNRLSSSKARKRQDCFGIILRRGLSEPEAFTIERALISAIGRVRDSTGPLFNVTAGGQGISGLKHRKSTIEKMKARAFGRVISLEQRLKISETLKNSSAHYEACVSRRSKPMSALAREKMSAAKRGKPRSAESILKCSVALKGKPWSAARRAAQDCLSDEARARIGRKGQKMSSEARMAMSAAQKKRRSIEGTLH